MRKNDLIRISKGNKKKEIRRIIKYLKECWIEVKKVTFVFLKSRIIKANLLHGFV